MLGATVALLGYVLTCGPRWFTYPPDVRGQQYDVLIDAGVADDAVRILHSASSARRLDDVSASHPDNVAAITVRSSRPLRGWARSTY